MKRVVLPFFLILVLLSACSPGGFQSEDEILTTKVAAILTSQPTTSPIPPTAQQPTKPLVMEITVPATETSTPTAEPSDTPTPEVTATEEPTPTEEPSATPTGPTPTSTMTIQPTFTPPVTDPIQRLGGATEIDPMDNATMWVWPTGGDPQGFTNVEFKDGVMLLTGLKAEKSGWRLSGKQPLGDFYLEMVARMDKCSANDKYGLIFRSPVLNEADRGYLYGITCDGKYYLKKWDGKVAPDGLTTTLISNKASGAIMAGPNQFNRLGVLVVGKQIDLYVNGVYLDSYIDSSFNQGYFGVFVTPVETQNLVVRVDQISLWKNPKP